MGRYCPSAGHLVAIRNQCHHIAVVSSARDARSLPGRGTVIPPAGISGIISFPTVIYGRPGLQTVPLNRATANLRFNCPASGELLPPPLIAAEPPLSSFHINIVISSGSLQARVHYEGY